MSVDLWVVVIIVGVVLVVSFVRHELLRPAAKNWPLVNATIELCYVVSTDTDRYSRRSWWVPVLGYSYEVDGERYSGSVGLEGDGGIDKDAAEEAGKVWRGQKIMVRFNPQRPEKSAFLLEDGAPPGIVNYADEPPDSDGMITSVFR